MKFLIKAVCSLCLLTILSAAASSGAHSTVLQSTAHDGRIESKYDGFSHETTITLKKMKVTCGSMKGKFKDACISLSATLHCPGIQLDYVREASLQVIFQTEDWDQRHSLVQRDLSVVADGQTFRLGRMKLKEQSTDTLMTETLEARVPYAVFVKLTKAETVEMKVGPSQFQLNPANLLALKDMANRVKV
jgi:hypothetical protein